MSHSLPFFPPSLPDETLFSRVSRYHLLRGNTTDQQTFDELFGQKPFVLSRVVPPFIDALAARLPGTPEENLQSIVGKNTLFPLFRPFLGRAADLTNVRQNDSLGQVQVSHMPSHVVGMSGDAKLCLSCVREDEQRYGVAYWHRAHQIPGVTVCWKHREITISSCPHCRRPFQRYTKLLTMPWIDCECSRPLHEAAPQIPASVLEHQFANFAYEMLMADIPTIRPDAIMAMYRDRIRKRGFVWGSKVALAKFTESMIETLGEDFIGIVDPAYSAKRVRFWIRLHVQESALDMPITRHLLLGMHLFGAPDELATAATAAEVTANGKLPQVNASANDIDETVTRDQHRKRILDAMRRTPNITLEKLWKSNYRATAWLFDNDNAWLKKIIAGATTRDDVATLSLEKERAKRDKEYADMAEQLSARLFRQLGKPSLITMEKMLESLPKRVAGTTEDKELYPLLFARIAQCRESSWCFRARRILWAISELKRLEMSISPGNIVKRSAVGHHAVLEIIDFCGWDCEALSLKKIHVLDELAKAGIGRTWRGPSDLAGGPVGGRGYRATRRWNRYTVET